MVHVCVLPHRGIVGKWEEEVQKRKNMMIILYKNIKNKDASVATPSQHIIYYIILFFIVRY